MAEVRAFLLLSCAYGVNAASCPRGHCGPSPQEKASRLTEATASKHGEKWTCDKCSTKFYDLNKKGPNNGAVCPECGNEVFKVVVLPPGTPRKPKSRSSFSRGGRPVPEKPKAEDDDPEGVPDDDDDGLPNVPDDDEDDSAPMPDADSDKPDTAT